jgi:hypothetical protein
MARRRLCPRRAMRRRIGSRECDDAMVEEMKIRDETGMNM